jgi:hypothetical protein
MHFATFALLMTELFRLSELKGNVGKEIKRLLDRIFAQGPLVLDVSKKASNLGYALYLQLLLELKADLALHFADLRIDIQHAPLPGLITIWINPTSIPTGMRDRQRLLHDCGMVLNAFNNLSELFLGDLTEGFFNQLEEDRGIFRGAMDVDRGQILQYFDELLNGDLTHSEHPNAFLDLARIVNPTLSVPNFERIAA